MTASGVISTSFAPSSWTASITFSFADAPPGACFVLTPTARLDRKFRAAAGATLSCGARSTRAGRMIIRSTLAPPFTRIFATEPAACALAAAPFNFLRP